MESAKLEKFLESVDELRESIKKLLEERGVVLDESAEKELPRPTAEYPNFTKWNKEAIDTPIEGLKVAPEDFYVMKDGKRKDYFTWGEAMEYERAVLKPNGWRLPTTREWYMLVGAYGVDERGENDHRAFYRALKMKRRGYIPDSKMDAYNEKLDSDAVEYDGRAGHWWSSTAANISQANSLGEYSGYFAPQSNYYKGYGFTVRCVEGGKDD